MKKFKKRILSGVLSSIFMVPMVSQMSINAAYQNASLKTVETNARRRELNQMLVRAVIYDSVDVVRELIDQGADVNYANGEGVSVLMFAAISGDREKVQLIIDRGGRVDDVDRAGRTAWMYNVWRGKPATLDLFVRAGARFDVRDSEGYTGLMILAERCDFDLSREEIAKMVRVFVDHGVQIDATMRWGNCTALWLALSHGNLKTANVLLDAGANAAVEAGSDRDVLKALAFCCRFHCGIEDVEHMIHRLVSVGVPADSIGSAIWFAKITGSNVVADALRMVREELAV